MADNNNKKNQGRRPGKKPQVPDPERKRTFILLLIPFAVYTFFQFFVVPGVEGEKVSYSDFYRRVSANLETHAIESCQMMEDSVHCKLVDGKNFRVDIPPSDPEMITLMRQNIRDFRVVQPNYFVRYFFQHVIPALIFIGLIWFFLYRGMQQGGGKIFSFGKSRAQLAGKKNRVTFDDVAGCDEAKEELKEIIEFLREPTKFQKLGGRIPKGVILMGPPGTGKTLIAKAVAGEADAPFFSISGSDFVEMFVGVGAARVRDLFEQAKKAAKAGGRGAIIFIDEIDAVGRQRFAGVGGGHDEREQTLNALLVEMDGFDTQAGVILIASTNRPDVLDSALLRPGRFDRQVVIDLPDAKGREALLLVHTKKIKMDAGVDLKKIAKITVGYSGADVANLVNEAALLAARRNKPSVAQEEFEQSTEKVMMGPERKSRVVSDRDKKVTAVHEAGHALVAILTPNSDPVHKISIIPRGYGIAGYTLQRPDEDSRDYSRGKILNRIKVLLGGRIAEKIYFNEITAGASNDLQRATQLAHSMVCEWGMSDRIGNLAYGGKSQSEVFMGRDFGRGKDYSEQTAQMIDEEVRKFIDESYKETYALIEKNRTLLDKLSARVLEKETLDEEEIRVICGLAPAVPPKEPPAPPSAAASVEPVNPSVEPKIQRSEPPPIPPITPAPSF